MPRLREWRPAFACALCATLAIAPASGPLAQTAPAGTSPPQAQRRALRAAELADVRRQVEGLLGPDQLDAVYSIATTADARLRSAIESVRARDGAYRTIRNDRARALRFRRDLLSDIGPMWIQSVRQIDALLSPQQQAQLVAIRDRFIASQPRARVNDAPLPGGYAGLGTIPSRDVGGFVLRVLLTARAPA